MLSPPKPRRLDQPNAVSLEQLVPADNVSRHLEAKLDLAHPWYLGYALDEQLSAHFSLTRIRQRLGIDVFQFSPPRLLDSSTRTLDNRRQIADKQQYQS
jgi:hypothetical protein